MGYTDSEVFMTGTALECRPRGSDVSGNLQCMLRAGVTV